MKRVPADVPGHDAAASRFAGQPAGRVRAVVYRPVVPYLLRPGLRVLVSGREAERVRHAGRGGLSRAWSHDRAHFFFARARWNADDLGLAVARLVVALLVPAGEPVTVAIDDTLFRRRGKKVWAASWFHDGSAPGPAKTGYGNNWVIAAVVVRLPAVRRPVAIPVLAKLVIRAPAPPPGCGWPGG
jgi:hypothetical protein